MKRSLGLARAAVRTQIRRTFGIEQPHLLLACMPKSASSFLASAIANLPGISQRELSGEDPHKEQELDPSLLAYRDLNAYVAQQHVRYSEHSARMIEEFRLTPIVLVRSLDDCVASIRDHVRQNPPKNYKWFPESVSEMKDDELEGFIVDMMIPWYIQFEVSWQKCPSAVWVHYDEVRTKPGNVLRRISAAAGLYATDTVIDGAIDSAVTSGKRFNKGVSGRGAAVAPYALDRIQALLARYPNHQFRSGPKAAPLGGINLNP